MAGGISNTALLDLIATTLPNLPKMEFEVALPYQNFPVCNKWFQKDKVQVDSGTSIERNIMLDTTGNAKMVRLYQKTPINVADVQKKITAPWCQMQTDWSVERRELLRNRGRARFVNLLQSRRIDATLDQAKLLERRAWATPVNDSDDLNPRGLPYWLSMRETNSTGEGFDAYRVRWGDGTTTTTKGGLDGSTTPNALWRNYAATKTGINAAFVKTLRRAFHATEFRSPMLVKDLEKGATSNYRLYMGLDNLVEYEDLVTKSNDNLGRDLDPFHGNTSFKRVPIEHTPLLNDATYSPVYGVNHAHFFPMVLEGDWMREDGPHKDVEQHNVFTTFLDSSFQYFCKNVREGGFVIHNVVTA